MTPDYTIVRPKDRAAWLEERKKGIGSSDAGTIMGVSPFMTPEKLWRLKKGLIPPKEETEYMRNGHYLELAVTEYFAATTNSVIDYSTEGDWLAVNNERPYLRVSPDRLFWPQGAERTPENRLILELKSTYKLIDPDELPLYWVCQVQYQMGVMGIKYAAIAWITSTPRLTMGHAWIAFNPDFYKTLTDAIDKFWNVNILKNIEPDPIDEDDAKLRWPVSSDSKLITADEQDIENCQEYIRLLKEKEELEERISRVTADIKIRMKDSEALISMDPETGHTETIARFKSIKENVFDEEAFRNSEPGEYVKYLKKSFDKQLLKEEDRTTFNKYSSQKPGARRFSVLLKE